jgi:hypothetical protein
MWLYPGPSCLDCSISEELSVAEIDTQIHMVLDHKANPNPGASPTTMREGVVSTRVSLFGYVLVGYAIVTEPPRGGVRRPGSA